jgi:hypothetical protein
MKRRLPCSLMWKVAYYISHNVLTKQLNLAVTYASIKIWVSFILALKQFLSLATGPNFTFPITTTKVPDWGALPSLSASGVPELSSALGPFISAAVVVVAVVPVDGPAVSPGGQAWFAALVWLAWCIQPSTVGWMYRMNRPPYFHHLRRANRWQSIHK